MRRRITRTIVAVTALTVLLLAVPLAVATSRLFHNEAAQALVDDAGRTAATVPSLSQQSGDPLEVVATGDGATIGVYGPGGMLLAGDGPARADQPTLDALTGRVVSATPGGDLVAAVPVGSQESVAAAVRASLPRSSVDGRIHTAWLIEAGVGLAAIAAAGVAAAWQARRLSRPLDGLADAARRLGGGDFSVRVARSRVPELDTVGRAMNTTAEKLAHVLDRERAFSADASHQLRTPLTALRLRLETALMAPVSDGREAVQRSLQDVDRLEQTVDDLLRLRRDVPGDRAPVDLARLVAEAQPHWHERLAAAGRPLLIALPQEPPTVAVSESAIRQILDVLVDNATVHGDGPVRVAMRGLDGGVAIDVSDDGPGVGAGGEQLFARRAPDSTGTGIGLSLARSLTEAEGGRLLLAGSGRPTVFRVVFPVS